MCIVHIRRIDSSRFYENMSKMCAAQMRELVNKFQPPNRTGDATPSANLK